MALPSNEDDDNINIHNYDPVDNDASNANGASSSNEEDEEEVGEQVRISLTLAPDCLDRSLQVPSEPLAVPATISKSGLSSVVNHLLSLEREEDIKNFDFVLLGGKSNHQHRLLRTGVEVQSRRLGLSLEEAIPIIYFPARQYQQAGGQEELPDWVSGMSFCHNNYSSSSILGTGCYDGSIHCFEAASATTTSPNKEGGDNDCLTKVAFASATHSGPIKCLATYCEVGSTLWMASGSMDHTLKLHKLNLKEKILSFAAICGSGHTSSVESVDLRDKWLASGDWDGGVCIWGFGGSDGSALQEAEVERQSNKKTKMENSSTSNTDMAKTKTSALILAPKISLRAHASKVSGLSWGNHDTTSREKLVTGSWDHSLRLWDVERQDCLLTLNGSRVISCLDTSYHSTGIVATGHPDCTVRLWDVRVGTDVKTSAVADTTLKPSHKGWVSDVKWAKDSPYHLASSSHDGTVKFWDIRTPIPLQTVRAFSKDEKALCLAFGDGGLVFSGGTDCTVKRFRRTDSTKG